MARFPEFTEADLSSLLDNKTVSFFKTDNLLLGLKVVAPRYFFNEFAN